MNRPGSVVLVALVSIVAAVVGLCYHANVLVAAFDGRFSDAASKEQLAGFYPAFYTMSAICVTCYLLLLASGVNLMRARLRWAGLLMAVLIFEVAYALGVRALWASPLGPPIAAATGVANGGLMVQFIILFPLWAPLVLWRARRRARHEVLSS